MAAAGLAARAAVAAERTAQTLAAYAAQEGALAASLTAAAASLAAAYYAQQKQKLAALAKAAGRALVKAAKVVGHGIAVVAKAAYKYSGAQQAVAAGAALLQRSGRWWGDVTSFVAQHKVGIGIALGVVALAVAPVGLVVGAGVLLGTASAGVAMGLGAVAVVAGTAAAALDRGACNRGDTSACAGEYLGLTGAAVGGIGLGGAVAAGMGLIAEGGTAATLMEGAGALGWSLGSFGTMADIGSAYENSHSGG